MKPSLRERKKREYARSVITEVVNRICRTHRYSYGRVAIKNQKSRLGSCSSKRNLNFNWQITKFPQEVMEYVIKHEVAHLVHQNHSKDFWKEVEKLDPNYKEHHEWLKKNGNKYLRF